MRSGIVDTNLRCRDALTGAIHSIAPLWRPVFVRICTIVMPFITAVPNLIANLCGLRSFALIMLIPADGCY